MRLARLAIEQPITIAVGVILALLAGVIAIVRVPVQMTPEVESVVIAITTTWEAASAQEIETDVVEPQEERLGNLSGLLQMTSTSSPGQGQLRLEFRTGTDIASAKAEVDQVLAEVPGYPEGVNQPVVVDIDPESVDYISWIGLASTDPAFDPTSLYDFMYRRLLPRFERLPGIAEVGVIGAREQELQIAVDPAKLAQRGVSYAELVRVLRAENGNWSGGKLTEGKNDVRVRAVGRFDDPREVEDLIVRRTERGAVRLRDVATVEVGFKERTDWARARGHLMPFLNFQLESGANLLEAMAAIDAEVDALNAPDGLLALEAERLGLDGELELVKTYDSTTYVRDALDLVRSNILIGGGLAVLVLLVFLRSLRTVGIIAVAIPISVIVAVVVLVGVGRSVNIVSLAGMAFAVGMVVDNAIVVIENIFRHLEMGKRVRQATLDGTTEVAGAVLASTLTTLIVFVPILLIEDSAGQLFRDIALAIVASVGISFLVSVAVIPAAASTVLGKGVERRTSDEAASLDEVVARRGGPLAALARPLRAAGEAPRLVAALYRRITRSLALGIGVVVAFAVLTVVGIVLLVPPLDYLPAGNRNIVFGLVFPPPAYSLDQLSQMGELMEAQVAPAWEVAGDRFGIEAAERGGPPTGVDERVPVPLGPGQPGTVMPPPLDHYFLVGFGGQLFQVAISADEERAIDAAALLQSAVTPEIAPDSIAFALQLPLFRTGGTTGSAVTIDLTARSLEQITPAAGALLGRLIDAFGPHAVQPDPFNFNLPAPELRIFPDDARLRELGLSRQDLGYAVQANSDGLLIPRQFQLEGELKDLKVLAPSSRGDDPIPALLTTPLATPGGSIVDLESVARVERVTAPDRIKRVDRQRAVSLELTPPAGMPLQAALQRVDGIVGELRDEGALPPEVEVRYTGSAGKLADIQEALLGDGGLISTLSSSLFLALAVVYLLMVVLFQSWLYPLVILVSVPLATLGGFAGLAIVHGWSVVDRYMPVQNLDVLTILGFVILAGVVVNNAILIVHQALHFVRRDGMAVQDGIAASIESRVRPIAMSTLTSVGGMLPLVLMPGSGSELYRGLGAVVVGGLVVSTLFTLVLVPVLLNLVMTLRERVAGEETESIGGGGPTPEPSPA